MKVSARVFLFIIFLFPSALIAQDDFRGFSVNLRMGPSIPVKYESGIFLSPELCLYNGQNIYSVEYSYNEEFTIFGESDYTINKLGFFYGKYWGKNWYRYQLQAGFGPLWGTRVESDRLSSFASAGIFLKGGIKLLPARFAAIGASLQLNINPEIPNLMLGIGIDLGKLVNPE